MVTVIIVVAAILATVYLGLWKMDEVRKISVLEGEVNGTGFTLENIWNTIINDYSVPFAQYCISVAFTRLTAANVTILFLKYVPMALYIYTFVKDIVLTSRERIKQKYVEMEAIELQIQIANKKLCIRDAEFIERSEQLRLGAERLRSVRARVRDFVGTDDSLRRSLDDAAMCDADRGELLSGSQEDSEFIADLLKEFKCDSSLKQEPTDRMNFNEHAQTDPNTPENSVYSSVSDVDMRPDCHVKIVRVYNVYKIAYLKHYIKQKKVRRATKQALLKKKIENIKSLLEDWQKTLNMVSNSKLTILNIEPHPIDLASEAAMGDYTKPRCSWDSDSDLRNSWSDVCYGEYNFNWGQNPYKPYGYNCDDFQDSVASKEYHESQDFGDRSYPATPQCPESTKGHVPIMNPILEETKSEMAIVEKKSDSEYNYE